MDENTQLQMLKYSLNILHDLQDEFLKARLEAAKQEIARAGIKILAESTEDGLLIVDYAAWMVRKRDQDTGFPRNLQYRIHSRIASQKMAGEQK